MSVKYYDHAIELVPNLTRYAVAKAHMLVENDLMEEALVEILLLIEKDKASTKNETKTIRSLLAMITAAELARTDE